MNEVATQSAALLLDAVEHRGIDPVAVWEDLPVAVSTIRDGAVRIDWTTWVAMVDRVAAVSPVPMEELFVPGSGRRIGHPFVRVAQGLLSVRDVYAWLAKWGIPRAFMTMRGRFESVGSNQGRFTMRIDPARAGSVASMQFFVGVLRHVPQLQGYPPTRVIVEQATPHHADYIVELPVERSFFGRARRLVGLFNGMSTTLDELAHQATEIATKNSELETQLAVTRERDEWLQVAFDAGRIGLWRWDPSTRRVRISGRLLDWLGTNGESEISTAVWTERIHLDDRAGIAQLMKQALLHGEPFDTQYRITSPSGQLVWLHLNGRTQTDSSGRLYAYGSATDITQEKLIESRMRMADRLIAAGTLAAGVAHEVNNPLTYVLGSVELMQLRLSSHPGAAAANKDLIAQVVDGVERIRSVVADIRSFARQDDHATGPLDPRAVCTTAIRIVATDVRHRAIVTTDLADDTPVVTANESKLGQVVINLLVNAVQAMPPRAVSENHIVVRTRKRSTGEAVIEVQDNGSGIAADVLPRLFDPFFTTKPIGLGTGLGLAVCEGIVASAGGRIEVASELGRGSTFSVILPAMAPTAARVEEPPPVAVNAPPTHAHVLVIDDEPLIRSVLVDTLQAYGYRVDEAANGREGLDRALAGSADQVILCDLMMPDFDGAMLYAALLERRPELIPRLLFISGGAVTDRIRKFSERSDVVVIKKPFAIERLVAAIDGVARS